MGFRNLSLLTSAGTALSNSTTHTVLASYSLPANSIIAGKRYRVHGAVIATATNSTDTLRVRFLVGPTTLTGTAVVDGTAVDVADNDKIVFELVGVCRASGVMVWSGFATIEGAEGTVTARAAFEQLTVSDTTAACLFEITGLWSVASASNSCRCDNFIVDEIV